jgi:hypothetical protein
MRQEELGKFKKPMTSSGLESANTPHCSSPHSLSSVYFKRFKRLFHMSYSLRIVSSDVKSRLVLREINTLFRRRVPMKRLAAKKNDVNGK